MIRTIFLILTAAAAVVGLVSVLRLGRKIKDLEKSDERCSSEKEEFQFWKLECVVASVAFVALVLTGCFYTQQVGQVSVLKNWTGTVQGSNGEAGLHAKSPFSTVIKFDCRNNMINFYGDGVYSYEGGNATGAGVSINDKSGVSAVVDIQVEYSLNAEAAEELFVNYGTQESFVEKSLSQDLRATARKVAGNFSTLQMLTERATFAKKVEEELRSSWAKKGLTVENVNVQAVNYDASITEAYSKAQAAEVAKAQALANQEVAVINAQTEIEVSKLQAEKALIDAEAQVAAAKELDGTLNDKYLEYLYIQKIGIAAEQGNLVISGSADVAIQGR